MAPRSAPPAGLSVERNVDLAGTARGVLARRVLLAVLALVPAAALVGVFGQRPTTSTAGAGAAVLSVYSPVRLRGGLLFTTRFEVHANRALEDAALVLDRGWFEGMQVNSMTPTPRSERSTNDQVRLELGRVSPNDDVLLFIQFQVNPTTVGRRSQGVRLVNGSTPLVDLHRTVLVFP
jgi:hypothetical protein